MENEIDKILEKYPTVEAKLQALNDLEAAVLQKKKLDSETVTQLFDQLNALRDQWLAQGVPDQIIERAVGKFRNRWYVAP
jgi:hypothetical protein